MTLREDIRTTLPTTADLAGTDNREDRAFFQSQASCRAQKLTVQIVNLAGTLAETHELSALPSSESCSAGVSASRARRTAGSTPIDRHIGWRLYQRRIEMGYSQSYLAQLVGVSFQQIHKYEQAHSRISAARLWSIASVLETEMGYFYDGLCQPERIPVDGRAS